MPPQVTSYGKTHGYCWDTRQQPVDTDELTGSGSVKTTGEYELFEIQQRRPAASLAACLQRGRRP